MAECVVVQCSGGAYWEGGSEGAGSIFTLGRFPEAGLRQYSLAGGKLTYVNTFKNRAGNFTSRAGTHLFIIPHRLAHCLDGQYIAYATCLNLNTAQFGSCLDSCPRDIFSHGQFDRPAVVNVACG